MEQFYSVIWQDNHSAGRFIVLLITSLGIVAARFAWQHIQRYRKTETKWLEEVRRKLRELLAVPPDSSSDVTKTGEQIFVTAPEPAMRTIEIALLKADIPATSLIYDRLATIDTMRQARVKVDVRLLQGMSVMKESAKLSLAIPDYAVGASMLLGLLGTLAGLSQMAGTLSADQSLEAQMGQVLGGVKTAFSTTLVGLLGSLIVSALNFLLARAQSKFYDQLERFTAEELLPCTVPAIADETVLEVVSRQLDGSVKRLEEMTQKHSHTIEYLHTIEEAFGKIINNIRDLTHRNANDPQQQLTTDLTGVLQEMTKVNQSLMRLLENLPKLAQSRAYVGPFPATPARTDWPQSLANHPPARLLAIGVAGGGLFLLVLRWLFS